jgi:ribosomal protein L29
MKKSFSELLGKSVEDLKKEAESLRSEMVKLTMEAASNPQKDSNLLGKKKKRLAVVLTALTQKEEAEKLAKQTK